MKDYRDIILGNEANSYINEILQEGNTLSQHIIRKINIQNGRVKTFSPSICNNSKNYNEFYYGGISADVPEPKKIRQNDIEAHLAMLVKTFISENLSNVCIIENSLANKNDAWVKNIGSNLLFFNDEVYHFLSSKNFKGDDILKTITQAKSIPVFIGYFASIPEKILIRFNSKPSIEISIEEIGTIANGIQKIFVGAYDGEGYLIWESR